MVPRDRHEDDAIMEKDDDTTQPTPADDAGKEAFPPAQGSDDADNQARPTAEGPATDGGEAQAGPPPPPQGYGQPPYGDYRPAPRLTRRTHDKVIGGVAGGVADYFGIDPLIVRLVFVALALAGGGGIVLYVLGWIFIPARGVGEPIRAGARIDLPKWIGIALLAVAALVLIPSLGYLGSENLLGSELFWALILGGLGVFLLRKEPEPKTPTQPTYVPPPPPHPNVPPPSPHSGPTPPAGSGGGPVAYTAPATGVARGASYPAPPPGYAASGSGALRRERSRLGPITLASALLAVGGAALLNNIGLTSLTGGQLGALALIVVGAGLVVGAWWGRARWLTFIGLLLLPFVALFNLVDVPLRGEVGSNFSTPRTQKDIDANYEVLAGDLTIDLGRYRFYEEPADLDLDLAFGEVTVFVPKGVYVEMIGSMEAGQIDFLGTSRGGRSLDINDADGDSASDARLTIALDAGVGHVQVIRSGQQVPDPDQGATSPKDRDRPKRQNRNDKGRP
jgi:phage shock protein PspC (stress-responsive transcriptional regulator)